MSSNRQIVGGALLSYLSIALNIIAGLLYTPWMVDQIGKADYGLYTLANSLITMFIVDFGLGAATSRYLSQYHIEGRQDKIDNFLGLIYRLYLILDAVIFLVLTAVFFLIDGIYAELSTEELERFKIVYLIAASFAVFNFPFITLNGILTACEMFVYQKLADIIYRILLITLTVMALYAGYGLYALVVVHVIAGLIIIVCKLVFLRRKTKIRPNFAYRNHQLQKEVFRFSAWEAVNTLAQRLIFNITPSILGAVSGSGAIAVFGVVSTIEGYAYTITGAINGLFLPKVTRVYAQQNAPEKIMSLFVRVGRIQFAVNGLIIAGFAVLGRQFIRLWMGMEYQDAYGGILLVTIPGIFYNSLQIANTALIVQKKVKIQACVTLCTGLTNMMLSFILSRVYGVLGACISIFAAYMIRAVMLNVVYWEKMKLDIPYFVKKCYIKMGMPVIGTIMIGMILDPMLHLTGWIGFAVEGGLIVLIYMLLLLTLGLEREEQKVLRMRIQSRWR